MVRKPSATSPAKSTSEEESLENKVPEAPKSPQRSPLSRKSYKQIINAEDEARRQTIHRLAMTHLEPMTIGNSPPSPEPVAGPSNLNKSPEPVQNKNFEAEQQPGSPVSDEVFKMPIVKPPPPSNPRLNNLSMRRSLFKQNAEKNNVRKCWI